MSLLISSDKINVKHFYSTKRFIDGICAVNDGEVLERSFSDLFEKGA